MNSRSQRSIVNEEAGLIAPLSGPSYGAFDIAKRRWRKPLSAILADALANNQAVLARFRFGIFSPDGEEGNREIFDQLCRCTEQQIAALKAFSAIGWRE